MSWASETFIEQGYVIAEAESPESLISIRNQMVIFAKEFLSLDLEIEPDEFLNGLHSYVQADQINKLRLHVFNAINELDWLKEAYYACARNLIDEIVGNEVAMQKNINLSIQMPGDTSSVLPIHADTWAGDSPYEVVLWMPFVDVFESKSMFILPAEKNKKHVTSLEVSGIDSACDLLETVRSDLIWLNIKYGQVLLFSQNLLHGNEVNEEASTRWSTNCRFKSLLSPYADKKLGEFFEPVELRPATIFGATYELPSIVKI